tara:strand:+ start:140 stop:355 length:216 start_codon:yes stop_codon:yes gene_type:complete
MSDDDNKNGQLNELKAELIDSQDALQNLVFQKSMQQLEDLSQIKKTRKKIARLKTLIHENKTLDNSVGVKE